MQQTIDSLNARIAELEAVNASTAAGVTRHFRRWMPFYALGAIFALFIVFLPTRGSNTQAASAGQLTTGAESGAAAVDTSSGSVTTAAGPSTSTSPINVGGGAVGEVTHLTTAQIRQLESVNPTAWKKTGITKGGFRCGPGIRQLPWSSYAVPCYPKWTGTFNGGATTRGVTKDKIIVVSRHFPDSANQQAVDAIVGQAGFATGDEVSAADKKFRAYFAKVFESWGRKVEYIDYTSKYGNSTNEALGQGQDGACLDADDIISKYHPFMVVGTGKNGGSTAVFGECAAKRKLIVLGAGAYFPEWWYQKYHPYIFAGVMNCTMIAYQNAEYLGKRIFHHNAKWAKGAEKGKPRQLGLYVPTNVEYQSCVKLASKVLKEQYNATFKSVYNYQLDVSRFADQAQQAIVRFHADGVTTIFLACDPLSPIFLTQDATNQGFFPEWITNGAGLTDVEQFARLWDQPQIQKSLWGMSQLGDTGRILGPKGEGTITYKKATGTEIPPGTQTQYYGELGVFGFIQAMGPYVTPQRLAQAIWSLPPGGAPYYEVGYTNYSLNPDGTPGHQHTSVSDQREIYWVCDSFAADAAGASRCNSPKSYDGKGGTYRVTYGGKRFRNGQWPREEPPLPY